MSKNKQDNDIIINPQTLQYPRYLTICGYVLFCGLYVLATLLPFVVLCAMGGLYYGYISKAVFTILIGLIVLDFVIPVQDGYKPDIKYAQSIYRFFGEGGWNYFPAQSICIAKRKLSKNKSYILASWPHGLLGGAGHFCFIDFHHEGYHPICSGASVLKYVPFLRRFMLAIGYCDVSKSSLHKVLNVKKYGPTYPYNMVHLVVGGIGEMFYTTEGGKAAGGSKKNNTPEQIIISKRKGFIKLAIETGADIIPTYTFGANQAYYRLFNNKSILSKISSSLQVSLVFWFGRWFIPMGLVPFQVPVLTVMGDVFEVPKIKDGEPITSELVQQVHEEFCTEMRSLFNKYKVVYVQQMNAPQEWMTKELKFENENLL